MATSPSRVRRALTLITGAAVADAEKVAHAAARTGSPADVRAALFAATPLIVGDYIDGSAALALNWYEELRDEAAPPRRYNPVPLTLVDEDNLASAVAWSTRTLYDLEQDLARMTEDLLREATEESVRILSGEIQKATATGFWDTVVGNTRRDPSAVGWRRYAQAGACKFCLMCAARGAVYTEATADFAAHTTCHCTAGPAFDPEAPRANAMQYVASSKHRTPEQQAQLRSYLNENYPDAPG